jgi:hypothetical protein
MATLRSLWSRRQVLTDRSLPYTRCSPFCSTHGDHRDWKAFKARCDVCVVIGLLGGTSCRPRPALAPPPSAGSPGRSALNTCSVRVSFQSTLVLATYCLRVPSERTCSPSCQTGPECPTCCPGAPIDTAIATYQKISHTENCHNPQPV